MHTVSEIKIFKKVLIVITLPHHQLNCPGWNFSFFNCIHWYFLKFTILISLQQTLLSSLRLSKRHVMEIIVTFS